MYQRLPCSRPFGLVQKVSEYFYEGIVGQNVDCQLGLTYIALVSHRFGTMCKNVRRCRLFPRDTAFRFRRRDSGFAIDESL